MNAIQVAQLIKENYRGLYLTAGKAAMCPMFQSDRYSWVNNQHIWPNRVYGLDLPEEEAEEVLREIVERMASGELPEILTTSIFTKPKNYQAIFARVGLEKKFEAAGMALDLNSLPLNDAQSKGRQSQKESAINITTKIVESEDEINTWCRVVMQALFEQPLGRIGAYRNVITQLIHQKEISCFMVLYDDQIVGTSMMYRSNPDIVGIYHVSTLEEYRRQGIGKRATLAPLLYAKELGCHTAVLFASQSGESIYGKLGFKTYCTFGRYGLQEKYDR